MSHKFKNIILSLSIFLWACNTTKHVPDGEYLLDKYKIHSDIPGLNQDILEEYLRQTPNATALKALKIQLAIYNIAGKDTTKKLNKFFMKIGEEPVLFSQRLTDISTQQIQKVVVNKGYIDAEVVNKVQIENKKVRVDYYINAKKPYTINKYSVDIHDSILSSIANDTSKSLIQDGMLFDVDVFDEDRQRVTTSVREIGFYNFNKEYLVYTADSTLSSHKINLNLDLNTFLKQNKDSINKQVFTQYKIRKVIFNSNQINNQNSGNFNSSKLDTTLFNDFILISPKEKFIEFKTLIFNTYISPNTFFNDKDVEKTYSALNSLGPVKYVTISFVEMPNNTLDCIINILPAKTVSLSAEIEGTYTGGYWGGAFKLGTVNKNAFNGAEILSIQGRLASEWQSGIWAQEYGAQVGLKIPRFIFPIGNFDFKRSIHANTEFASDLSYQFRPSEFTASNISAGTSYSWDRSKYKHNFELFNLSLMNFDLDQQFITNYIDTKKYNIHNYESRFILRMGYKGSFSNFNPNRPSRNYSTYRYSIESAGNLLYGLNKLLNTTPSVDGNYKLFNIAYAQYVRGEYNTSYNQIIDKNNRFVYHLGVGLGLPYGNADVLPFERRFYSGGANSVRGWGETKLGPGIYQRDNTVINRDYNQVGDIKLDLNMEYRAKLFWFFEGALFLDGGNVWTIKKYDEQPGGEFRFDTFINQIAIAYGAGLRMDFSFFIARIDLGFRLFDPALQRTEQWRIKPGKDDFAFHLGIGYPF